MLHCTVKFCGGCNPRYDRGAAYRQICSQLDGIASFSYPEDGVHYDVLLILRGCTGCSYLYEEISAEHRIICTEQAEADHAAAHIAALA
ncbi:hypothetical protein [Butyricicoccus sp.]|uniref:hypothetical protein n=1 Tax=Butyricicoccus sp. TaxID=2049021 RepID=UPI003F141D8C